jgi:hypothetical protein
MLRPIKFATLISLSGLCCATAGAATVEFFDASQIATTVESGVTWDTISSNGYLFTYTRDKLFTGGTGHVIGRQVRVPWPEGVEAQSVTTPPPGVTDYKARITLQRVDGSLFDLTAFSAQLLANTAGAGGSIEIMPLVDGEDAFNDPLYFNVTGYYGFIFSFDESPNPWGSTAALKGFDTYKIGLYVDFALTALTLEGAPVPGMLGDYNQNDTIDAADYTVWRDAITAGTTLLSNDPTPGAVDESDFLYWRAHFGQSLGSGAGLVQGLSSSAAVPEPATCVDLLLGTLIFLSRRSRQFRQLALS